MQHFIILCLLTLFYSCSQKFTDDSSSASHPHHDQKDYQNIESDSQSIIEELEVNLMKYLDSFDITDDIRFSFTYKDHELRSRRGSILFKESEYEVINNALLHQVLNDSHPRSSSIRFLENFTGDISTLFGASLINFDLDPDSSLEYLSFVEMLSSQNISIVDLSLSLNLLLEDIDDLVESISSLSIGLYHFDGKSNFDLLSTFDPIQKEFMGRNIPTHQAKRKWDLYFSFSPKDLIQKEALSFGPNSQFFIKVNNIVYQNNEDAMKSLREIFKSFEAHHSLFYIHDGRDSRLHAISRQSKSVDDVLKLLDPDLSFERMANNYMEIYEFLGLQSHFSNGGHRVHTFLATYSDEST